MSCCEKTDEKENCCNKKTCGLDSGLFIIVLFILLAIILGPGTFY